MIRRDRRAIGQTRTLYEAGVDMEGMRRERLKKVQREMAKRDIGALVLNDINNIRYTTGIAVMPIWTSLNLSHCVIVPVEGSPVIFEYSRAIHRADQFFKDVRPAYYWQGRFAEHMAADRSEEFVAQVKDILIGWGVADSKIGVDIVDYYGFTALQKAGLNLTDCDRPIERAR